MYCRLQVQNKKKTYPIISEWEIPAIISCVWLHHDPFANYKIKTPRVDRGYLTQEELDVIIQKEFSIKRIEQIRDVFIFACFTGLAYIDVKNLRETNVRISFDGNLWIMTKRQKTGVQSNIPLLDVPRQIIEKYNHKKQQYHKYFFHFYFIKYKRVITRHILLKFYFWNMR